MNVYTKWNCLIPILSGLVKYISCFRDENVSHKSPMCISDKITTVPRLFSEHLTQNENKHQIMNVHTKWNCLIPILSSLVCFGNENVSYKESMHTSGKITTLHRLISHSQDEKKKHQIMNVHTKWNCLG